MFFTVFYHPTPLQRLSLKTSSYTKSLASHQRNLLLKAGISSRPPNRLSPRSGLAPFAVTASLRCASGRFSFHSSTLIYNVTNSQPFSSHLKGSLNCRPRAARFPCDADGEPGCDMTFADRRGRLRHREKVCRFIQQPKPTFRCCCNKTAKRWYRFREHQKICATTPVAGAFLCECAVSFSSFMALEEHYNSEHRKTAGRPRKSGAK